VSRLLVVDASIVVDLIARFQPEPIEQTIWAPQTRMAAPELLDVEVLHAMRRLDQNGQIPQGRTNLVEQTLALPIRRYRHASLLDGIWSLRGHISAYDGAYVVLTRLLNAILITRDERLARASGLGDQVLLI
jgi:predicted nucleic acid-binding protein